MSERPDHPAKFTPSILIALRKAIVDEACRTDLDALPLRVLDPFAGVGGIHHLRVPECWETWGVELEPEWAGCHPRTAVGDATNLPFASETFDVVATSPAYGNRMADHHEAKDGSKRITYRHKLGRPLSRNNSGGMQWGAEYRELHLRAWIEAHRVLKPRGLILVNVKNHIRHKREVDVAGWHLSCLQRRGFAIEEVEEVEVLGMGFGANRDARVAHEVIIHGRKLA